jgi:hypothetical protein
LPLGVFAGDIYGEALAQLKIACYGFLLANELGELIVIELQPVAYFNSIEKDMEMDIFQMALEAAFRDQKRSELYPITSCMKLRDTVHRGRCNAQPAVNVALVAKQRNECTVLVLCPINR